MKKSYRMQNLDCANCAARMEEAISKIDGVNSVVINFMLQRITIDADDATFDDILKKASKVCSKVHRECFINI
ncbi:MAG: heavy-metal-associated domain-containing protein [Clostridia bacterium]|nr:heavy-metal-associated domain-containing protein [Clostridia bacterium]